MVKCDSCKKQFEVRTKVRKSNEIEEVYFECPYCKMKYTAYFTNKKIRVKQKKINSMWDKYRKSKTQEEVVKMVKKIDDMKLEIRVDMNNLKNNIMNKN